MQGPNFACFKLAGRRSQLIMWADEENGAARSDQGVKRFPGRRGRTTDGAMVGSGTKPCGSSEERGDATELKEKRKARKEKPLAR